MLFGMLFVSRAVPFVSRDNETVPLVVPSKNASSDGVVESVPLLDVAFDSNRMYPEPPSPELRDAQVVLMGEMVVAHPAPPITEIVPETWSDCARNHT